MRQTEAMAPAYAVRWWGERNLEPPEIDPVDFFRKRVRWRYAKGRPELSPSTVYLGDASRLLGGRSGAVYNSELLPATLLLTSPPYWGVTNYYYDQWLRLWLLGGRPDPRRSGELNKGKFEHPIAYRTLLERVFGGCAKLLKKDAVVYVRTDHRPETYEVTRAVLKATFPQKAAGPPCVTFQRSDPDQPFRG
jgi:hypothetical protein